MSNVCVCVCVLLACVFFLLFIACETLLKVQFRHGDRILNNKWHTEIYTKPAFGDGFGAQNRMGQILKQFTSSFLHRFTVG